jgi:hypothetical protein
VPPCAAWKKTLLVLRRARERAFLVAEELAFHQVLRYRSTVHREERAVASHALLVDQARRELLAAPGFPRDVNRRLAPRDLPDHLPDLLHRRGRPEEVARRLGL